ncbi:sugar phosphate isomerase/epimerase [Bacillus sp. SORGH_AS 510]|uniref:sugar phosphate isomerase/epimerase family protein n=1 Tax=Bacillus sp. SORGH_AS_0510 TaxID=3041771 RepID=UPI002785E297|nr:TIM barrel protein [Bacillus sp. SORGH_AS_0510]MDQ1143798.1 sugar phosphate isomerase/epimerase [Bacillus sp. SORGH_AS_0510]
MKLGLNLSFATKRWLRPEILAKMIKNDFNVKYIQFTWDLIDPWWPVEKRDVLAKQWSEAFKNEGLELKGTFGGLASYTYAHLLAPSSEQREIAVEFFKRAIDLTITMGTDTIGTPIGGMSHEDAINPEKREELYGFALESIREIAAYGKERGLKKILIEATPLDTEFPHSPEASVKLMKDLEGTTAVPVRLLIDWGHALFKPLLKDVADMALWLKECSPYVDAIHLQQTDGLLDRHWDFTSEGIITPELIKKVTKECDAEDIIQYLEVVTPFEAFDDEVYHNMKETMKILTGIFEE